VLTALSVVADTLTSTADPDPSASTPAQLWNEVSDAATEGPDAMSRLLLNLGDLMLKAALVIVALLLTRLIVRRLINAIADRIATSAWSGRWGPLTLWPGQQARPRTFPRTLRRSDVRAGSHPGRQEGVRQSTALTERRKQRARAIASLLGHLSSATLVVIGVLIFVSGTGLYRAGVFTAGLLGVIAAVSVQGLARDIVAGLFILIEDTYGIGDHIDTTFGAAGVVEEIGLRTSRLRGRDGTIWHVRHSEIARVGNRTQAHRHLTLDVRAGFGAAGDSPALPATAAARLAAAERVVRMSLTRLDRDLTAAATSNPIEDGEVAGTLAEILPVLVPAAPRRALAALAAATSGPNQVDTRPLALEPGTLDDLEHLGDLLEEAEVPVLTDTTLVGLVDAGEDHVLLRVTAQVADTSREQALAVLRRRLFLDLNAAGFSASFTVPAPADL